MSPREGPSAVGVLCGMCGMALGVVCLVLAYFTMWVRIDSDEELWSMRNWDILLGLLFAVAVLLVRTVARSKRLTLVLAAATWVCVSAFFLDLHDTQVRIRSQIPRKSVALNQLKMI